MADPADPSTLGSALNTEPEQASVTESTSTENKYLSYKEVASLAASDRHTKGQIYTADRQQLFETVSKQFHTFEITPPKAFPPKTLPPKALTPKDLPSHNFPSSHVSPNNISPNDLLLNNPSTKMPYNNTAIPPPEEVTGSAALPLARVKRILQLDEDINSCSANAAFAITVATEMFIRYLAEQSLNVVKSERKPRRNIQYKDVANAVARIDNLEFLADVVPKTVTYREFKQQKAARAARKQEMLQSGQTTLDASRPAPKAPAEIVEVDDRNPDEQLAVAETEVNGHEPSNSHSASPQTNGNGNIVFQHYQPNGDSHADEPRDVEMG